MKQLTPKAMALLYSCCFFGVLSIFDINALWFMGAMLITTTTLLVIDYRRLLNPQDIHLDLSIPGKMILDEEETLTLTGRVRAEVIPSDFVIHIPPNLCLELESQSLRLKTDRFSKKLKVRGSKLGRSGITELNLIYNSPYSFFRQLVKISLRNTNFNISPAMAKLSSSEIRQINQNLGPLLQGARGIMRHRSKDQLYQIRKMIPTDPVSSIDPRKSARYNKLMVREYETIIRQHVIFAVDLGRSLSGKIGSSFKKDFYIESLINLYRAAIANRDKVSLILFHQDLVYLDPNAGSTDRFRRFTDASAHFNKKDVESNYDILLSSVKKIAPQRAMLILLTDVTRPSTQEQVLEAFKNLTHKHIAVASGLLAKTDNIASSGPTMMAIPENWPEETYRYWLQDEYEKFKLYMKRIRSCAILSNEKSWQSTNEAIYQMLRRSLNSG